MAKAPQPARKSYFFGKGYRDLGNTIKGAWSGNFASIRKYKAGLQNLHSRNWAGKIFFAIVNVLAMLAVLVCGSAITAAMTLANILVLLVFMACIYLGFTAIWLLDRIYLVTRKIFAACDRCKNSSLIPTYLCPGCGEKHTNLTPGVYGILRRTCDCGQKLPTAFFNGRKDLPGICPHCLENEGVVHYLNSAETRPLCIPVVGARSVGKTAFITAFSKEFIDTVAPAKGIAVQLYSDEKERIYRQITADYTAGSTRMTERPQDNRSVSSVSFSFFAGHPSFKPDRLVHIYDIAGEVFTDNTETEVQKQYEYCAGIVFVVDPFSIPTVRAEYEELLTQEDIAGIGGADLDGVIDAFMEKLRQVTGLSDEKMSRVPLAVVINKIDSAGLEGDIGARAVGKRMTAEPDKYIDFFDTQDYLCRKFLRDNGMAGFLNRIDLRFKRNRFFACSAIGHTRDAGQYRPVGVLPPMEWLFRQADSAMGRVWNDHTFTKNPVDPNQNKTAVKTH